MLSKLAQRAPYAAQNLAITAYNSLLYRQRHGGEYHAYRRYFERADRMSSGEVQLEASRRLEEFLAHATSHSPWYRKYRGAELADFEVLTKRELVEHFDEIRTIDPRKGIVSHTGGTTGASLKVVYRPDDMQERFAILDHFRAKYGYALGKRVAWFSGKDLATRRDVERGKCFRDDYLGKIRFFATFHLTKATFPAYWRALEEFRPEYMVGFPSTVAEICTHAKDAGLRLTPDVKCYFPTAETVLASHRSLAKEVLGAEVRDQYASSEGAPFILECSEGALHIHPLTGIFEVVDSEGRPASAGDLLVTSFSTRGTPLIRYRVGDSVSLAEDDETCRCGSAFPRVREILGRTNDYVLSVAGERVNLGNLSNATKGIPGILGFQIQQKLRGAVDVLLVPGASFGPTAAAEFERALRLRLGTTMQIRLVPVEDLPREASGKFRLVKNFLEA